MNFKKTILIGLFLLVSTNSFALQINAKKVFIDDNGRGQIKLYNNTGSLEALKVETPDYIKSFPKMTVLKPGQFQVIKLKSEKGNNIENNSKIRIVVQGINSGANIGYVLKIDSNKIK